MASKTCTPWRIFSTILSIIAFFVLLGLAINSLVRIHDDYKENAVATMAKLHQNESVTLADTAVCVPLSFMTNDPRLVLAAKHTLLHDPTFLSKALRLENDTAAQLYWDRKNNENGTTVTAKELIEGFVNETLKPFLKRNITFPDENPVDKFLAQEAEIFDIIETSAGTLVNKTILLASVALIDVITGFGDGRSSASSLLLGSVTGMSEQEMDLVANMAKNLLSTPPIAEGFASNVARTLCEITAPEWSGNLEGSAEPVKICGSDGLVSKKPYYISLNEFCFDVPTSSTPFTKSSPTATLSLTLPLAQSVFAFGPLSDLINSTAANLTMAPPQFSFDHRDNDLALSLNSSSENEENNQSLAHSLVDDIKQQSAGPFAVLGAGLPFAIPQNPNLNFSFDFNDNETQKLQAKFQHQIEELLHSDILSLALRFPIVSPRPITIYFPNDMRYYDSDFVQGINVGLSLVVAPSRDAATNDVDDFYSKTLTYVIKPTDLVEPNAEAVFGMSKSTSSIRSNKSPCSNEISTTACTKKCTLTNIENVCKCTPFGTHRLLSADGRISQNRFCHLDDETCINRVKNFDAADTNSTSMIDCRAKCVDVCSTTRYKWRNAKSKPAQVQIGGNINALITGQPTHWTWSLTCDSFDYVEYVEKELITWNQYMAQVGGVMGFYATIFGLLLLLLYVVGKLIECCCRGKKDKYNVAPNVVGADFERNGYNSRDVTLNGDVRKAIEEAVMEMMKRKSVNESTENKKIASNGLATEKKSADVPQNTYVSRIALEPQDFEK